MPVICMSIGTKHALVVVVVGGGVLARFLTCVAAHTLSCERSA